MTLRQRAIDVLVAYLDRVAPDGPSCALHPNEAVDALIAAGLIRDETPVHRLAAWADANNRSVSLMRTWGGYHRPWIVEEHAQHTAAWQSSIDVAAQYALDRIKEAGNE